MPKVTPPDLRAPVNCFLQAQNVLQTQTESENPAGQQKKIFIFCDGTGNEFTDDPNAQDANSNVVKLYTTVRIADHQVAYYHPGVGTLGDPGARHGITRKWSMIKGLAFAAGFKENVFDAYRYLMDTYRDGDEIYLFGFSRGAYTARALAGLLHGYGLLCSGNEGHLPYAWKDFAAQLRQRRKLLKKSKGERAAALARQREEQPGKPPANAHAVDVHQAFLQTFSRPVIIRFMGIWDTVSSVGWIYEPLRLLDMAQNPIIQVGRHAVSLSERRAFYRDNIWGDPLPITDAGWPATLRSQGIQQDIMQVWFPGVHSDIGGSYSQQTSGPANIALHWMIDELKLNGAELCEERIAMVLGRPCDGGYAAKEVYLPPRTPDHCLHESLTARWWPLQFFPQQYYDKDEAQILWRVPLGTYRCIPDGAILHSSAAERLLYDSPPGEPPYSPPNIVSPQTSLTPLDQAPFPTAANLHGLYRYTVPAASLPTAQSLRRARRKRIFLNIFWGTVVALALNAILSVLLLAPIALTSVGPSVAHWLLHHFLRLWAIVVAGVVALVFIRYRLYG